MAPIGPLGQAPMMPLGAPELMRGAPLGALGAPLGRLNADRSFLMIDSIRQFTPFVAGVRC